MEEERMRVLDMVAAGIITPEQGEELLSVLEGSSPEMVRSTRPAGSGKRIGAMEAQGRGQSRRVVVKNHEDAPSTTLDNLDLEALIKLGTHGVSAQDVRELRDLGFTELTVDDVIKLGTHGVDPQFVREMRDMGFGNLSIDDLVRLGAHGVSPDFVREMHELGFIDLGEGDVAAEIENELDVDGIEPDEPR